MKKVTSLLLLVGVAAFGLVACGDNVVPPEEGNVEGVTVTPSVLNIAVGGSGSLSADVDGDPDNSVTWASNNASVATVDGEGNVTGVAEGNAVVTATSTVDDGHSASAEVNVTALEDADISIQSVTNADALGSVPDDVEGRIFVRVNLEEGDKTVDDVQVYFEDSDGNRVLAGTQQFASASQVEGAEAQGEVSEIEFNINTADADGELDGSVRRGKFSNGLQSVIAVANVADGSSVEATWNETLTFDNVDRIEVTAFEVGEGMLNEAGTFRYFGGMDLVFAATPVIYNPDLDVASITVVPSSSGGTANIDGDGPDADLGAGHGTAMQDSEAPFQFTAAYADNLGSVEDDAGVGGHSVTVTDVRDPEGAAVAGSFDLIALTDFYIDDTAPAIAGTSEITQDGSDITEDLFYNEGVFGVSDVTDLGVGGISTSFDADVISTSTEPDYEDVSSFADLMEHGDADEPTTPSDVKVIVTDVADRLENSSNLDPTEGGTAVDASGGDAVDAEDNASEYHGVDHTAPDASNLLPADGGSATYVFNGDGTGFPGGTNELNADIIDPDLADGNAPSGKNDGPAMFEIQDDAGTTLYGPVDNTDGAFATGTPTYSGDPSVTADGARVAIFTFEDNAVGPNDAEQVFEYILDTTAPEFSALDPTPTSTSTGASSVVMNIGGDVADANAIADATISVHVDGGSADDIQDAGATGSDNGTCETTDYKLSVDDGEIDRNDVTISDGTASFSFEEAFEITDPGVTGETVKYCFFVTATDEALDNTGAADGNTASTQTNADVEWTS